jgi:acetyl esterase/lipase
MSRQALLVLAAILTLVPEAFAQRGRFAQLPEGTKTKYDIPYVEKGTSAQKLDLFVPAGSTPDKPLPLVVWIHGGGWRGGDKARCLAMPLLEKGYAVASINYRLSGEATFPAQIHDCKAAIRWLRANAKEHNIDPEHIGVWGGSAGGHLVALLGTSGDAKELEGDLGNPGVSSKVQAVCDFFGPAELSSVTTTANSQDAVAKLLGGSGPEFAEKAKQASPVTYITPDDPPFLIIHGKNDRLVGPRQSQLLHDRLKEKNVEATLEMIDGAGHGGPQFTSPDRIKTITAFFDKHLKQAKP